jgi:hypothetical protein
MCLSCHSSDENGLALCPVCEKVRLLEVGKVEVEQIPLEDTSTGRGLGGRVVETVKLLIVNPIELYRRLRSSKSVVYPLVFGYIFACIGLGFGALWQIVFEMPGLEEQRKLVAEMGLPEGMADTLMVLTVPFQAIFYLGINALILHLSARLLGGRATAVKSFQIYAYSCGALVLNIVPFVGVFASLFVQLMAQFTGLRVVHGLTLGRALLACAIPLAMLSVAGGI